MKLYALLAAFFGLTSVVLGAFAAHGLKAKLAPNLLSAFETGVQYQMYHALALLLVVVLFRQAEQSLYVWAGIGFTLGIVLFSGSLYALALTGIKWFGPVTPLGGVCFIVGWGLLLAGLWRSSGQSL